VPVGSAASFTDPFSGAPAYAVQPTAGVFHGFSAVCTHAGCTVDYSAADGRFLCPCHGAEFDAATGAVLGGPTNQPLPPIDLRLGGDGQLYVTD
jgi:thiosulfate dehydrogenase [quinone] large subunit